MKHEIKCYKCGNLVASGKIRQREPYVPMGETVGRNLKSKNVFSIGLYSKINGTIIRNGSRNYKNWIGICSKCQREKE